MAANSPLRAGHECFGLFNCCKRGSGIHLGYSGVISEIGNRSTGSLLMEVLIQDGFTLNELLQRYRLSPQVGSFGKTPSIFYVPSDEDSSTVESTAVMRALQLAERDELDRVRECKCGKFFSLAGSTSTIAALHVELKLTSHPMSSKRSVGNMRGSSTGSSSLGK